MKTIAAISTPVGSGGIGVVRISGDDALGIINKIFVPVKSGDMVPFTLRLGNILDGEGEKIDQVLASYFKAPKSYTGEDVIEISCHGGYVVLKSILNRVLDNRCIFGRRRRIYEKSVLKWQA